MQNSHCKIIINKKNWSVWLVLLLSPLLIVATIPILPTFDDWTSLIAPSFGPLFTKERFLFYGYHWRPFDSVFGWLVGRNPHLLFPALNHIVVVAGHLACTLLVYRLTRILRLNNIACNIATTFYFLTPAMLATVLAVDGLNQTYAHLWGLAALMAYLSNRGAKRYVSWIIMVIIATLCKENGLMWMLITPLFAYAFDFTTRKTLIKDLIVGCTIIVFYALCIILLPSNIVIHPEYVPSITKTIKDIFKFLLTTFVCVDYVSLLHAPNRNWIIAIATFIFSMPFMYHIWFRNWRLLINKKMLILTICLLIAVAPHVFTVFSMMHTYAGMGIVAIMIAVLIDHGNVLKPIKWSFALFILSALFIDLHLTYKSYESGLMGKQMSKQIIEQTGTPVNNVTVLIIEDDYPRLSSFCVIPSDAIGWGIAVKYENNYQWPAILQDSLIERTAGCEETAESIAKHKIEARQADCVWIVNRKKIKVIK